MTITYYCDVWSIVAESGLHCFLYDDYYLFHFTVRKVTHPQNYTVRELW